MMVISGLMNGFANEKVLPVQEQNQTTIEEVKIKTIEMIEKSKQELLEEVRKEPIGPLESIKDMTLYKKQQDSELLGLSKAHNIATELNSNLKDTKDSEIVGECYGAIYNDEKTAKAEINKTISISKCIGELVAIKLILSKDLKD